MKRYFIIDIFGNERQCSKVEFYCIKFLVWGFNLTMLLVLIGVLIDCWKSF